MQSDKPCSWSYQLCTCLWTRAFTFYKQLHLISMINIYNFDLKIKPCSGMYNMKYKILTPLLWLWESLPGGNTVNTSLCISQISSCICAHPTHTYVETGFCTHKHMHAHILPLIYKNFCHGNLWLVSLCSQINISIA